MMTLAPLIAFPPQVSLVADSGVQFLDFGLTPEQSPHYGHFVRQSVNGPLLRLDYDADTQRYLLPDPDGSEPEVVRPELRLTLAQTLEALDAKWLPLPLHRLGNHTNTGPVNWARVRICALASPDEYGHSHRVTLALDTRCGADGDLQLTPMDVGHSRFALNWRQPQALYSPDSWLCRWLMQAIATNNYPEAEGAARFSWQGHWLNLLQLLACQLPLPEFHLVAHENELAVDLVLDLGTRRCAGLLSEQQTEQHGALTASVALQLRHLSNPETVHSGTISSHTAFACAEFGSHRLSLHSGRSDGFIWPSAVRCGQEGAELLAQRPLDGGLSSPLRYLWDGRQTKLPWQNASFSPHCDDDESAWGPLSDWLDDDGQFIDPVLGQLSFPAAVPSYPKRSLLTLQLCEFINQALCQINSPQHRLLSAHPQQARRLNSITLTTAAGLAPELSRRLESSLNQAIGLIWNVQGWSRPRPQLQLGPDSAAASQWPWLYQQLQDRASVYLPDRDGEELGLRLATLDIGGGYSQLAVVDYRIALRGDEHHVRVRQRLSRSYPLAADDLLLDILQRALFPGLITALTRRGVDDPERLIQILCGNHGPDTRYIGLGVRCRQQIWLPVAARLLNTPQTRDRQTTTLLTLLEKEPDNGLLTALDAWLKHLPGNPPNARALLNMDFKPDFNALERAIQTDTFSTAPALIALCSEPELAECDWLLLTGGAANMPELKPWLLARLPLPSQRVIDAGTEVIGPWFPLRHHGRPADGKALAVAGALLQQQASQLSLANMIISELSADAQPIVTGPLTRQNLLAGQQPWSEPDSKTGIADASFFIHGPLRLGVRPAFSSNQLASPRYQIYIADPTLRQRLGHGEWMAVRLTEHCGELQLASAWLNGEQLPVGAIALQLNTLNNGVSYWIDAPGFSPLSRDYIAQHVPLLLIQDKRGMEKLSVG